MNKKLILLVEDTPVLREQIVSLLKMQDYEVLNARDGVEALEILDRVTPALIITDVLMPQMDGFEMLTRVKAKAGWREIPTVVLTARSGDDIDKTAAALGVSTVLRKPCRATALLDAVKALIPQT